MNAGQSKWPNKDGVTVSLQDLVYQAFLYYQNIFLLGSSTLLSLTADGNTILNLPRFTRKIVFITTFSFYVVLRFLCLADIWHS
jgi:hypothetical protein